MDYKLHLMENVFLTREYIKNLFWMVVAFIMFPSESPSGLDIVELFLLTIFYSIFGWLEDNMLFLSLRVQSFS